MRCLHAACYVSMSAVDRAVGRIAGFQVASEQYCKPIERNGPLNCCTISPSLDDCGSCDTGDYIGAGIALGGVLIAWFWPLRKKTIHS